MLLEARFRADPDNGGVHPSYVSLDDMRGADESKLGLLLPVRRRVREGKDGADADRITPSYVSFADSREVEDALRARSEVEADRDGTTLLYVSFEDSRDDGCKLS